MKTTEKTFFVCALTLAFLAASVPAFSESFEVPTFDYERRPATLVFDKIPERVLSTNGSTTELLLRLGLEKRMVGTCYLDNELPSELLSAYDSVPVISKNYPKKETVLSLKPDLLYGWRTDYAPHELGDINYWNKIGIKPLVTRDSALMPQKVAHIIEDLNDIGKIFAVSDKTSVYVDKLESIINNEEILKRRNDPNFAKPNVMLLDFETNGQFLAWGEETVSGDMLEILGAKSSFLTNGQYTTEDIIKANPDIIILFHMDHYADPLDKRLERLYSDRILSNLPAFKNKRIYPIPAADLYCPGIRAVDGLRTLAKIIHPDLFSD
jgi:iron complex transport system substrate-binding protein